MNDNMRVRLRAPEETDSEMLRTPVKASPLPPLDVRSPDFIEERLENLKRKPTWRQWLDHYVEQHPQDDDDESDEDDEPEEEELEYPSKPTRPQEDTKYEYGLVQSVLWSIVVIAMSPIWVVLLPCLWRKGRGFWPLGCGSLRELYRHAVLQLVFIMAGSVLVYWSLCHEVLGVGVQWQEIRSSIEMRLQAIVADASECQSALIAMEKDDITKQCGPVGIDLLFVGVTVLLWLKSHRVLARYLMVVMAVLLSMNAQSIVQDHILPTPEIFDVDPAYALIDEEIVMTINGQHLVPGATIAWVAYWGCASTQPVGECEKQFAGVFEHGTVEVTFTSIDHFIPCYRDPPNPLEAQEFKCFPAIRVRVKDKQSIPGWSLTAATTNTPLSLEPTQEVQEDQEEEQREPPNAVKLMASKAEEIAHTTTATVHVNAHGNVVIEHMQLNPHTNV